MEKVIENASLKTADRAAREREKLMKKIGFNLDILTLHELKIVNNYIEARFHL